MNTFLNAVSRFFVPPSSTTTTTIDSDNDGDHLLHNESDHLDRGNDNDDEKRVIFQYICQQTRFPEVVGTHHYDCLCEFLAPPVPTKSLIMGFVQSGKSEVMFTISLMVARLMNMNVIVILRDFRGDYHQFTHNFQNVFLEYVRDWLYKHGHDNVEHLIQTFYAGTITRRREGNRLVDPTHIERLLATQNGGVVVALANTSQLHALNEMLERSTEPTPFVILMDEVDDIHYGQGQTRDILEALSARALHTIGISATVFDPIHDHRFLASRVRILTPPEDYKGVEQIRMRIIEPLEKFVEVPPNRLSRDPALLRVLDELQTTTFHTHHSDQHPMILLLKNERLKQNQVDMMRDIIGRYGRAYTIIVHNGDASWLYTAHPLCPDRDGIVRLPACGLRGRSCERIPNVTVFPRAPIQDILQMLKRQGGVRRFSRIIIVSHDIIGRGINIVSRDFAWHLTHMFYRPSDHTTVPMMLQSLRLCGRYRDNIPLTLYAPQSVILNIMKGHRLQQEVMERIMEGGRLRPSATTVDILRQETFHPHKIPRKSVFLSKTKRTTRFLPRVNADEDHGWTLEKFHQDFALENSPTPPSPTGNDNDDGGNVPPMSDQEFHRLTNPTNGMFKKWANSTNTSAIARFMREGLDPNKAYTQSAMKTLCSEYGIQKIRDITTVYHTRGHSIGQILIKCHQKCYRLHPSLIEPFQRYF